MIEEADLRSRRKQDVTVVVERKPREANFAFVGLFGFEGMTELLRKTDG
jgi:hypothetical protein